MTGMVITLIGFGGFGAWAALAPLASAAMAPGIITVDSSRKTVQHLDGGIIAEILVREGDRVQAGQVLMRLDDLETGSTVALLESQFHALMAQEARLEAERDGQPEVRLLPSLIGRRGDSMAADILAGQERIFAGRRSSLAGREAVTRQQITQLEAQIAALTAQRTAGQRQIALVREESAGVEELVRAIQRKPFLTVAMVAQRSSAHAMRTAGSGALKRLAMLSMVLRSIAMAWGAAPDRTRLASSFKRTSRRQCRRFSMPQCSRPSASSASGAAWSRSRLVMA
jgi:HlyD family type I secretion membrane fusion protein